MNHGLPVLYLHTDYSICPIDDRRYIVHTTTSVELAKGRFQAITCFIKNDNDKKNKGTSVKKLPFLFVRFRIKIAKLMSLFQRLMNL